MDTLSVPVTTAPTCKITCHSVPQLLSSAKPLQRILAPALGFHTPNNDMSLADAFGQCVNEGHGWTHETEQEQARLPVASRLFAKHHKHRCPPLQGLHMPAVPQWLGRSQLTQASSCCFLKHLRCPPHRLQRRLLFHFGLSYRHRKGNTAEEFPFLYVSSLSIVWRLDF